MKLTAGILFTFIVSVLSGYSGNPVSRMNIPSVKGEIVKIDSLIVSFNDTLENNILLVYYTGNGIPVKYSRRVETGVCINNECRNIDITIFWDVTGRYLGFELPANTTLTKNRHQSFSSADYNKLHTILGNELSPLSGYSISGLVSKSSVTQNVDAVSSATNNSIHNYIVKGAVYTTYTLWHIVYGTTKSEIEKLTLKNFNSQLALKILSDGNNKDKLWVLDNLPGNMKISDSLTKKLLLLISEYDLYMAEKTMNSLSPEVLTESVQHELYNIFKKSGYLKKKDDYKNSKKSKTIKHGNCTLIEQRA